MFTLKDESLTRYPESMKDKEMCTDVTEMESTLTEGRVICDSYGSTPELAASSEPSSSPACDSRLITSMPAKKTGKSIIPALDCNQYSGVLTVDEPDSGSNSTPAMLPTESPSVDSADTSLVTDEPKSSELTDDLRAEDQSFWCTIKRVKNTRKISGRDYTVLNGWGYLISLCFFGTVYSTLYAVAAYYTSETDPQQNRSIGLWCIALNCAILLISIAMSVGYCLCHRSHILIRTRGAEYLATLLVVGLVLILLTLIKVLVGVEVISIPAPWVLKTMHACLLGLSVLVIGTQAARQRLLYKLFVRDKYRIHSAKNNTYRRSWAVALIWSLIALATGAGMIHLPSKFAFPITVFWFMYSTAFVLAYYTYLCRTVSQAFSDWRDVLLSVVLFCVAPALNFSLRFAIINQQDESPQMLNADHLHFAFTSYGASVLYMQLFFLLAVIHYARITVDGDLDPAMARNCVLTRIPKSNSERGTCLHGSDIRPAEGLANCKVTVCPGPYGPDAVLSSRL